MRKTKIGNKSKEDWILDILKVIVLSIVTIITVYPFWNIFIISINDATDAIRGGLYFLPRKLSFSSYLEILTKKTFLSSIKVSVARTVIGTPIAVLVTSMLAYVQKRSGRAEILEPAVYFYHVFRRRPGSLLYGFKGNPHAEYVLGIYFPADDERI